MANRLAARARPGRVCVMHQEWRELLFLHWSMDTAIIQRLLPNSLRVDTFDGRRLGLGWYILHAGRTSAFCLRSRGYQFLELNLRTYVVDRRGRPGVWFFSLDTGHRLPVWIAAVFSFCPIVTPACAQRSLQEGSIIVLRAYWRGARTWSRSLNGNVRGGRGGDSGQSRIFLIERYRLFAHDSSEDRLFSGQVHHAPYRYSTVKLEAYSTRLFHLNGLRSQRGCPNRQSLRLA